MIQAMQRLEGDDAEREAGLIRNTGNWPRWPWLPIKRYGLDGTETAFVYADDVSPPGGAGEPIRVFASTSETAVQLMGQVLVDGRELPVIDVYESVEALIAGGWMGD
jgi:hypothetical protein